MKKPNLHPWLESASGPFCDSEGEHDLAKIKNIRFFGPEDEFTLERKASYLVPVHAL